MNRLRLRVAAAVLIASSTVGAAWYVLRSPGSTTRKVDGLARVVTIRLTPVAPKLTVGLSQGMTAAGTLSDGTKQNVTTKSTWTSTAPGVATVTDHGELLALSPGQTTIRAVLGEASTAIILTVSAK